MRALICILLVSAAAAAAAQSRDDRRDARDTIDPGRRPPAAEPARTPKKPAVDTAPFRAIPKEAVHGKIRHLQEMVVEIDGEPELLSAGAQIRNVYNNLVPPVALPAEVTERADAKYLRDGSGKVHRVWLLTEKEIAALPPPPFPK